MISAAFLLEQNPSQLKITDTFRKTVVEEFDRAVTKGLQESNPFLNSNVRAPTKAILMYPHAGRYFDFQPVRLDGPIQQLNQFLKDAELKFSLHEGKFYLKIQPESQIFNQLWATDFAELLEANGYSGMEKNIESPHITLVNSDIIAKIREQFCAQYGKDQGAVQFETFFDQFSLSQSPDATFIFTELCSTYSEDYSPFEEVIVAKLEAPFIETALRNLVMEVERVTGLQVPVKPKSSFHLTVATKYRKPNPELPALEGIIQRTGKYANALQNCIEQFTKQ